MLTFETVNELTLKVTCTGSDVLFTKAGAFIAGENAGGSTDGSSGNVSPDSGTLPAPDHAKEEPGNVTPPPAADTSVSVKDINVKAKKEKMW